MNKNDIIEYIDKNPLQKESLIINRFKYNAIIMDYHNYGAKISAWIYYTGVLYHPFIDNRFTEGIIIELSEIKINHHENNIRTLT